MSEAATTTVSPSVIVKPDLPSADGKAGLITMRNIWKTYDMGAEKVHALHGVSFDVRRGEYLAITGPSGSGKSTLMNLIGCLDTASQGDYWLNAFAIRKSASCFRLSICWRERRRCTTSNCR